MKLLLQSTFGREILLFLAPPAPQSKMGTGMGIHFLSHKNLWFSGHADYSALKKDICGLCQLKFFIKYSMGVRERKIQMERGKMDFSLQFLLGIQTTEQDLLFLIIQLLYQRGITGHFPNPNFPQSSHHATTTSPAQEVHLQGEPKVQFGFSREIQGKSREIF